MRFLSKSIKQEEPEMQWSLVQPSHPAAKWSEHQVNRCWTQDSICVVKCIKVHSFPPSSVPYLMCFLASSKQNESSSTKIQDCI